MKPFNPEETWSQEALEEFVWQNLYITPQPTEPLTQCGLCLNMRTLDPKERAAEPVAYTSAMGEAAQSYYDRFTYAHKLPAQFRWSEVWDSMASAAPQPAEPTDEVDAMEAVMGSIDPATWPGLTSAQRCALGRFAKPQSTEPVKVPSDSELDSLFREVQSSMSSYDTWSVIQLSRLYAREVLRRFS